MTTLSLRLPDELLHEVDVFAEEMHIPRAAYVRKTLEQMNASHGSQSEGQWREHAGECRV